uniref:Uncharacterized protein n=1 Tax=Sphaerodactylus townsendi TaxID=933632 RepID=A0ACB8EFQ7_9SAUR
MESVDTVFLLLSPFPLPTDKFTLNKIAAISPLPKNNGLKSGGGGGRQHRKEGGVRGKQNSILNFLQNFGSTDSFSELQSSIFIRLLPKHDIMLNHSTWIPE